MTEKASRFKIEFEITTNQPADTELVKRTLEGFFDVELSYLGMGQDTHIDPFVGSDVIITPLPRDRAPKIKHQT